VRDQLATAPTVTDAVYAAGFNSSSRFYERSTQMLGMKPRSFRSAGLGERIRFGVAQTSLGALLVAATEKGICSIALGDDADQLVRELQDEFSRATLVGDDVQFQEWIARVIALVESPGASADMPLDLRGTAFQQRVWQALRGIPAGTTMTYEQIAREIGAPKSVRAVARACATNRSAIAVPCHRVVRKDGDLSGYRWGVDRKRELLARETKC
jgi:AraC family transcriptional regulator of adaptative response/methylated-DNA-[protein]-cysteine methyltransferase